MSNVTNVLLTSSLRDADKIDLINELVRFRADVGLVSCVDPGIRPRTWGGDADIGMSVAVGACGELKLDQLLATIRQLGWERPDLVQLFICGSDDERFTEISWRRSPSDGAAP